ncbi:MAG TPA: hypothetical protein VKR82_07890 [Candidatus Acidoferrales bacterium]|nr:hypothetical protein [Candidatus Acidoferrales bacterium]
MILSTVPGMVTLGCSGIRAVSRFNSAIFADLAMRGFAISFLTLVLVEASDSFLAFLWNMANHDIESKAIQSHSAQLRNIGTIPVRSVTFGSAVSKSRIHCEWPVDSLQVEVQFAGSASESGMAYSEAILRIELRDSERLRRLTNSIATAH